MGFGGGTEAGPVSVTWISDTGQIDAAITRVGGRMQGFATTVRGAGIQMQLFGQSIVRTVAGVLGAFITFEEAFVGVRKTVDATEEEFDLLERGIRDMALQIPVAAADLARIMQIAGQMGIRGVNDLLKFTETIALMGAATDLTEEQASFAFARISTIMQAPIEDVGNLGSSIVDLGNKFATTEPLITDAAVRASGAANTLGLNVADMLGAVAAATVVMPRAQSAGSSLTRIWTEMAEASFTGGESLGTFASIIGETEEATANLIKEDPAQAFIRFIEGMGEAIRRGEDWVTILDSVGLNQIRTRELVLNLAGAGDLLRNTITTSNTAWEENIALNEEAERRFGTLSSEIGLFKNLLTEINIIMGEALAPVVRELMDRLQPFFNAFRGFVEDHPNLVAALLSIAAALGVIAFIAGTALIIAAIVPVLTVLGGTLGLIVLGVSGLVLAIGALIIFFPEVKEFFENLPGRMKIFAIVLGVVAIVVLALAAAFWVANIAAGIFVGLMAIVLSPIFLIIAGIILLIAAIAALIFFWPQISEALKNFGGLVVEFFTNTLPRVFFDFVAMLKRFGVGIRDTLQTFEVDIHNKLKEFGLGILHFIVDLSIRVRNKLKEFGLGIKNTLRDKFDQLITPVIEAFQEIVKTVSFWFNIIRTIFTTAFNIYIETVRFRFNIIRSIFKIAFNVLRTIVEFFVGVIRSNWGTIMSVIRFATDLIINTYIMPWINLIRTIFTTGWSLIVNIVRFAWDLIVPIVTLAINLMQNNIAFWFGTLKNLFTLGWKVLWSIVKIVWVIIKNLVLIGVQLISGIIRFAMAVMRGDWGAAWDAIRDTVTRIWGLIKDTVSTVAGEIWAIVISIWGFILAQTQTTWTLVKDSILDALRGIRDTGKVILNALIAIIWNAAQKIIDGLNKVIDGLQKAQDIAGFFNPFGGAGPAIRNIPNLGSPPQLGRGGIALSPTLAIVGDVPEAIIPLNQLGGLGMGPFFGPFTLTVVAQDPSEMFEKLSEAFQ